MTTTDVCDCALGMHSMSTEDLKNLHTIMERASTTNEMARGTLAAVRYELRKRMVL